MLALSYSLKWERGDRGFVVVEQSKSWICGAGEWLIFCVVSACFSGGADFSCD